MSGTQVVAVKRTVLAFIAPLLADVEVRYGPGGQVPQELVYLGRASSVQEPLAMRPSGGRIRREETVRVPILIRLDLPGDDEESVEARAVEISTVIEEAVAADPTLSGAVLVAVASSVDFVTGADDDGGLTTLTLTLLVKVALT